MLISRGSKGGVKVGGLKDSYYRSPYGKPVEPSGYNGVVFLAYKHIPPGILIASVNNIFSEPRRRRSA